LAAAYAMNKARLERNENMFLFKDAEWTDSIDLGLAARGFNQ
jgi:hypothetical protein